MSRSFCALVAILMGLAAASAQPNAAQTCIPLGGPLLTDCKQEIDFLNQPNEYPLTSTTAPDDAKVQSVISSIPAGLPSTACCTAVQKFDSAGCSCEASLSQSLQAVGVSSTPKGLAGVSKIAATACKFTPYTC